MRNRDRTVPPLDRGPLNGGCGASLGRADLESPRFLLVKPMARPMLSDFNVEVGARCRRAVRGGARRKPVDRSLCRPEYRKKLDIVAGVKVSSLSGAADTEIYLYRGNGSATSQQIGATFWDFGGSTHSRGFWYLSRGVVQ